MTKTTEWEKRFDARKRLISEHMGGFYKDQYSVNWDIVKDFICKEIESARREVIAKEKKKTLDKVYEIRKVCDHASPCNCLVYSRAISDVLATLREEGV